MVSTKFIASEEVVDLAAAKIIVGLVSAITIVAARGHTNITVNVLGGDGLLAANLGVTHLAAVLALDTRICDTSEQLIQKHEYKVSTYNLEAWGTLDQCGPPHRNCGR